MNIGTVLDLDINPIFFNMHVVLLWKMWLRFHKVPTIIQSIQLLYKKNRFQTCQLPDWTRVTSKVFLFSAKIILFIVYVRKRQISFYLEHIALIPNLHIECNHLSPVHPPNMWLEICGFDTHGPWVYPEDIFLCEPTRVTVWIR